MVALDRHSQKDLSTNSLLKQKYRQNSITFH